MFSCISCWHSREEEDALKEIDLCNSALHDVPPSIFLHERTLDTLYLNSNRIQDLPLPLFYCQNLQFLNLSDNLINVLPAAIGLLVNLKTLNLSRNRVKRLDESIKGCKKLSVLNLSTNPLKQFPQPITQLISLEELYLNDTGLDYVPANVGRLIRLKILELRDNRLSTLPKALVRFSQLSRLDIGQNDFLFLPDVVEQLHELQELWMDLNGMTKFPLFIGSFKKLNHLDVSENCYKEVCEELGECNLLTELTLTSSYITRLPPSIGRITNLVTLNLNSNRLRGLPQTIGDLANLEELYVSFNKLETIPSSIGLLRKLICLGLDSNSLQYLPPEIGSCINLRILTVQKNILKNIPPEIGNLINLSVLSLADNQISCLPMSVLNLVNLRALWLVDNQSKPLTPLLKEYDPRSGAMVLTCYLLPQRTHDNPQEDEAYYSPAPKNTSVKPKIRFSLNPMVEKQNLLYRSPTPYPKKLRDLAKSARAIASQTEHLTTDINTELSVVNITGTNIHLVSTGGQVRTAFVKKHLPTVVNETCMQSHEHQENVDPGQLDLPPPYHIAASFSKQAPFFQNETYVNKEDRRSDIDTEALSSLKVELLHNLPPNGCQRSQSEQSGSFELIYPVTHNINPVRQYSIANSDVDSAFVDNVDSNVADKKATSSRQYENDGTYSAIPGIIITENSSADPIPSENVDCPPYDYDSSRHPISKVNSWLTSGTKSPVTSENGCELMNMYPCENGEQFQSDSNQSNQESNSPVTVVSKRKEELIPSSKITKPSKLPWLFGAHRNPRVVEVTIRKTKYDSGFKLAVRDSGIYIARVSSRFPMLRRGDKILQVDGVDIDCVKDFPRIVTSLQLYQGSFTMMISR